MTGIIIIEDTEDYRLTLQTLVNSTQEFTCLASFASAEECIRDGRYRKAEIAVVDINLPGMSGIELVSKLHSFAPGLLCLMCTAYEEDDKIFKALEAGAHGYILKSASYDEILFALREIQKGGSPMSSQVARKVVIAFSKHPEKDFNITKRERELLEKLSKGFLYKEIAADLNISVETVRRHCFNIYRKLHVSNRTEALNKFYGR
ncbi:MAG: response regulator transcription factor [Chitinophagaceae bacterium]|nr:MAG: response regulator transcription factor [Chitinophagaceae bacterium]